MCIRERCDVMLICRRDRNGMNQAAACIHTDLAFHPEFPLIALFRLMHFRVTLLLRVFRRTGGIDDGRIHDGAAFHHVAGLYPDFADELMTQVQESTDLAIESCSVSFTGLCPDCKNELS